MLPYSYTSLADAPTIVLSPHQHQFDPISSRAAHSYIMPVDKPMMPTKPWDAYGKQFPDDDNTKSSKKRTREESEDPPPQPDTSMLDSTMPDTSTLGSNAPSSNSSQSVPGVGSGTRMQSVTDTTWSSGVSTDMNSFTPAGASKPADTDTTGTGAGKPHAPKRGRAVTPPSLAPPPGASSVDYTQSIGIGWSDGQGDPIRTEAWKGMAKWWGEQLGISNPLLVCMNHGRGQSLIKGDQGYYLVSDSLRTGCFLDKDIDAAFKEIRLRQAAERPVKPEIEEGQQGGGDGMDLD